MVSQVKIPVMDQTTESVKLAAWLKREGDAVKRGDVLCEIETDKANVEIESPADGVVRKILIEQGTAIPPRTVIALIGEAGEPLPQIDPFADTPRAQTVASTPSAPAPAHTASSDASTQIIASPRARKLAQAQGIDLATIRGTGPEGRILEDDVKAALQKKSSTM